MTSILQWTALTVCVACTAWRLPSMLKGRNRGLFWTFTFISISVALSINALYLPLDGFLGGRNIANAILRLSLLAVFFLLATKVAAAYQSPLGRQLICGPVGVSVLGVCAAGVLVSFFLSDLQGSSTGLSGFGEQASVQAYKWFGLSYMSYAAAVVVVPTGKAALSSLPALDRLAALLMCVGFILVCALVPLELLLTHRGGVVRTVSLAAVLFVAIGLATVWVSFIRRPDSAEARL